MRNVQTILLNRYCNFTFLNIGLFSKLNACFTLKCIKTRQKSLRISSPEIHFILLYTYMYKNKKSEQISSDCTWWPVDHSWIFPPTYKGGDCATPGLPIGCWRSLMSSCHGISPSVLPLVFSCWLTVVRKKTDYVGYGPGGVWVLSRLVNKRFI